MAVDSKEVGIEGRFWLCDIRGPAQEATEEQAHTTDLFEEGWWIVEIVWYAYQAGTSPRKYKLLPVTSKRWLAVNAIIRVDGLEFEGGGRTVCQSQGCVC